MVESLLEKIDEILLDGEPIRDTDFTAFQERVEYNPPKDCYGADCGDCDSTGDGYCID